jgi:hypothetical protein
MHLCDRTSGNEIEASKNGIKRSRFRQHKLQHMDKSCSFENGKICTYVGAEPTTYAFPDAEARGVEFLLHFHLLTFATALQHLQEALQEARSARCRDASCKTFSTPHIEC